MHAEQVSSYVNTKIIQTICMYIIVIIIISSLLIYLGGYFHDCADLYSLNEAYFVYLPQNLHAYLYTVFPTVYLKQGGPPGLTVG